MHKGSLSCKCIPKLGQEFPNTFLNTWADANGLCTLDGLPSNFNCNYIWSDGSNIYYSYNRSNYILNGDTWEVKTWNGLTNFYGSYIWTDGINIFLNNYILLPSTAKLYQRANGQWIGPCKMY